MYSKISKFFKIFLWKMFKPLPLFIRGRISRKLFSVNLSLDEVDKNITYQMVSDVSEITDSLELIQNNYKRLSMTKSDDILRANKYHLLPTTTIFTAKYGDEVIGTISVILDSTFGLPIDSFEDISSFRKEGTVAEIAGFTVKESWRSRNSGISIPLALMALRYCFENLNVDNIVLTVRDSVKPFYEDICKFEAFGKVKTHDGVEGLRSASLVVKTADYYKKLENAYEGKPLNKSLFLLFKEFPWAKNTIFPTNKSGLITQRTILDSRLIRELEQKSSFFNELSDEDKLVITNFTKDFDLYRKFMNHAHQNFSKREDYRYYVNLDGNLVSFGQKFPVKIIDVAKHGLRIFSNQELDKEVILEVDTKEHGRIVLICETRWAVSKYYGVRIMMDNDKWDSLIAFYENELSGNDLGYQEAS